MKHDIHYKGCTIWLNSIDQLYYAAKQDGTHIGCAKTISALKAVIDTALKS